MAPLPKPPNHPYDMEAAAAPCAGVDEAGRGCLAGPVVAAAVILPKGFSISGLKDSKQLSPHAREILRQTIISSGAAWSIGIVWQKRIDEINILQASLLAMARALLKLETLPALALIDGRQTISEACWKMAGNTNQKISWPDQKAIVHGDALIPCISAASIMAKTWRDALMTRLAAKWPAYGFEKHKGYGTREHLLALRELGPCPLHRLTFRGVLPEKRVYADTLLSAM